MQGWSSLFIFLFTCRHCEEGALPDEAILLIMKEIASFLTAKRFAPRNDRKLLLNTRLAQNLSRSQIQFTGMTAECIRGERRTILIEFYTWVQCVKIWLFSIPDYFFIGGNTIQIRFPAWESIWTLQHNSPLPGLDEFIDFCVKRIDFHIGLSLPGSLIVCGKFTTQGPVNPLAEGVTCLD